MLRGVSMVALSVVTLTIMVPHHILCGLCDRKRSPCVCGDSSAALTYIRVPQNLSFALDSQILTMDSGKQVQEMDP